MDIDRLLTIYELQKIGKESMVDSSDVMNYHTTAIILFFFVFLISIKQYILKPIQCWVPPEFARSWEAYAENYCWVQPTYFVPYDGSFPSEKDRNQTINYYQWVPFILLIQMCICIIPYFLWKRLSNAIGINFQNLMISIKSVKQQNYSEGYEESISNIAEKMVKLFINMQINHRKLLKIEENDGYIKSVKTKVFRYKLFLSYLCIKIIFIITAIIQIIIMKYFIGNIGFMFGLDIVRNMINGTDWKQSNLFPRISGCDIVIRRSGQPIKYSFLCVLPVNMLNEKIYTFLWFWMVLCMISSLISCLIWTYRIFSKTRRKRLIYKLLLSVLDSENIEEINKDIKRFINDFLNVDGLFIVDMITRRYGDMVTSSIIEKVFASFQEMEYKKHERSPNKWI